MRLSRIFIDIGFDLDSDIVLPADKGHYVKNVLRLKKTQNIVIFNGREMQDYLAEIVIEGKKVSARIISTIEKHNDSVIDICLIQAIGKSEHMDFILQKATELGVNRFQLFNAHRTQSPLRGKRLEKKLDHWRGITISACEQSNRNRIPTIDFTVDLNTIMPNTSCTNRFILDFQGKQFKTLIQKLDTQKSFALLVGCEGGFSKDEIGLASEHGFKSYACGPRTLRMETAAVSIVSIVQHHFGDMS